MKLLSIEIRLTGFTLDFTKSRVAIDNNFIACLATYKAM